jgi:hypothetical protein
MAGALDLVPRLKMTGAVLPLPHISSWRTQGQLSVIYFTT